MPKFKVWGKVICFVSKEVDAENPEDAVEKAYEKFGGVGSYVGNGGWNKLIGVTGQDESIEAGDEIEWEVPEEEV
jgi:hypothetical protein